MNWPHRRCGGLPYLGARGGGHRPGATGDMEEEKIPPGSSWSDIPRAASSGGMDGLLNSLKSKTPIFQYFNIEKQQKKSFSMIFLL